MSSSHPQPGSSASRRSSLPDEDEEAAKQNALDSLLETFWSDQIQQGEEEEPDFKHHSLPLARIKKVMKSDEETKMISAEAPIIFSRACELFISELTKRSYLVAETGKRKTLQRTDVKAAIKGSDAFDFLLDMDLQPSVTTNASLPAAALPANTSFFPPSTSTTSTSTSHPQQTTTASSSTTLPTLKMHKSAPIDQQGRRKKPVKKRRKSHREDDDSEEETSEEDDQEDDGDYR